jgi:hypothetical protein
MELILVIILLLTKGCPMMLLTTTWTWRLETLLLSLLGLILITTAPILVFLGQKVLLLGLLGVVKSLF